MKRKTRKIANRAKATRRPPAKRTRPASQPTPTKKSTPAQPPTKSYILLGADEYAKPRAARFSGEDPALLAKAAEAMHLRLVEITEPDVAEIAALLPAGRLHASGKGLVPYIKGEVYTELMYAALPPKPPQPNPDPAPQDLPRSWDDLAPSLVVIAKESLELGWWEAIVVERTGDLVTVKYRDYPQYPPLVRHRSVVALISAPRKATVRPPLRPPQAFIADGLYPCRPLRSGVMDQLRLRFSTQAFGESPWTTSGLSAFARSTITCKEIQPLT
jgi:hypothetical protein